MKLADGIGTVSHGVLTVLSRQVAAEAWAARFVTRHGTRMAGRRRGSLFGQERARAPPYWFHRVR